MGWPVPVLLGGGLGVFPSKDRGKDDKTMSINNLQNARDSLPKVKRHKTVHQSEFEMNGKERNVNIGSHDALSTEMETGENRTHQERQVMTNQFGETVIDPDISIEKWVDVWKEGKTKFHKKEIHGVLKTYMQRLTEDKKDPNFFIPLCGKSVDMKWLLDQGYHVTGCDIAEEGAKQFFEEHEILYTMEMLTGEAKGKVFKGKVNPISIYVCDFYEFHSVAPSKFDCIWDRGSFAAINTKDRTRYCDVMTKLIKPDGRWLLDVFELDHVIFAGPPFNQDTEELHEIIGDQFDIEQLRRKDAMNPWSQTWGVSYFIVKDFLITLKGDSKDK